MLALHNCDSRNCSTISNDVADREINAKPISAERVKYLLREIAVALHATRVVGWKNGTAAPRKG